MTLRLGWFSTARTLGGSSAKLLQAALDAIDGGLDARLEFVFSNRDPGDYESSDRFFDLVHSAGIPLVTLSNAKFRRRVGGRVSREGEPLPEYRREYDAAIAELIAPFPFDVAVLAGYMLITTDVLCNRWPLINLHPALPDGPIGVWQEVVWHLIEQQAVESGVLMFLATTELDRGPPITYCRYSLRGGAIDDLWAEHGSRPQAALRAQGEANPLHRAVRARGAAREPALVVETLRALAEGRVRIERTGGRSPFRVADAWGRPIRAYDLTEAVERDVGAVAED